MGVRGDDDVAHRVAHVGTTEHRSTIALEVRNKALLKRLKHGCFCLSIAFIFKICAYWVHLREVKSSFAVVSLGRWGMNTACQ